MDYRVEIYKKNTGEKTEFKRTVLSLSIDRRLNMQTATANVIIDNGNNVDLFNFASGEGIIDNYNTVKIYIDNKIQFTGIIKNYNVNEDNRTIEISCSDINTKVLKAIDDGNPYVTYNSIKSTDMIKDLVHRAGIGSVVIDIDTTKDYIIKNLKIQYDTQISDVIDEALATLEARARILKDGTFKVEKLYPHYKASDVENNINYNWYYEDFIKISSASGKRNTETLYNRVLVRYNEKTYNVFEEPRMIEYLGGEKRFKEVDSPLSDTLDKRQIVANRFFLDNWRENTNLDVVGTKGNPNLDLGQIVRLKLDNILGHYMITGIKTELTADGNYIDQISFDGMRESKNIAKLSDGNYTLKEGE
ncbi:hypothetical protein U732_1128 [Clostridium argentinense CDC 2741]|uniref:Uncharacterized protein n=1 Tax=Clostridium argentinense CDC 2741 TaxID=1418104 RepID=A0A0C1U6H3_9CLOT|nr:hypothetical protein [Clostridium argentinense]ARC85638.1 hypothetical protein RSJ17_14550 [Clostridium argentinense]KIE47358.1 hypothetical protein U732_1128 [Clostridium argentinense CDC 2741]NFF40841.1 hypothetical protein [Clostridium argentinense]NFP50773.1 hypothetical protein [Clostridium argentinense]NFP73070.1 hypothetical protein [Clostridium argentinense]